MKYKAIILVLAAEGHTTSGYKSYDEIIKAIKETWATKTGDDILVLYYYGRQGEPVHLEGNNLICGYKECIGNIGLKTIQAFNFVNANYDYDYIVRCCAGSYINVDNLKKHLKDKPRTGFCSGIEGMYRGIQYVSGSCYILSRDAVDVVTKNASNWNHTHPDDVAIGQLLVNNGFKLDVGSAKRVDLNDNDFDNYVNNFKQFSVGKEDRVYERFEDNYHIHFHNRPNRMYQIYQYFEMIEKINERYLHYCNKRSDINEHLPTLLKYASECKTIVEFGVRGGVSTWAFLRAHPEKLLCVDIDTETFKENEAIIRNILNSNIINFKFINGDTLKIDIPETDLLFIDTLHTYSQLYQELERHCSMVKKYIILHDTFTYGDRDEDIYAHASNLVKNITTEKSGLNWALSDFLGGHKEWEVVLSHVNNNGLTVLGRKFHECD